MVLECYEKYENFLELRMTSRREKNKDTPGVNAVLLESRAVDKVHVDKKGTKTVCTFT